MISPVYIIGTGLLGTSLGLKLSSLGSQVYLDDVSPSAMHLACDLGAGSLSDDSMPEPQLVVIAAPPDCAGELACAALERFPHAYVTDVSSVKKKVIKDVIRHPQAHRFVGSHPMAGKETSGAIAGDEDLFSGRPWVITPIASTDDKALEMLKQLALSVDAFPIIMPPDEHDRAVGLVSHIPQILSSLLASQLTNAPESYLSLTGQGLRDMTRIAGSDPTLWASIIAGNTRVIQEYLITLMHDINDLIDVLDNSNDDPFAPGLLRHLATYIHEGNRGVARIPGKHGGTAQHYSNIVILLPDEPGKLGQLFVDIGQAGINIEDVRIEHSSGQSLGRVNLFVQQKDEIRLSDHLKSLSYMIIGGN